MIIETSGEEYRPPRWWQKKRKKISWDRYRYQKKNLTRVERRYFRRIILLELPLKLILPVLVMAGFILLWVSLKRLDSQSFLRAPLESLGFLTNNVLFLILLILELLYILLMIYTSNIFELENINGQIRKTPRGYKLFTYPLIIPEPWKKHIPLNTVLTMRTAIRGRIFPHGMVCHLLEVKSLNLTQENHAKLGLFKYRNPIAPLLLMMIQGITGFILYISDKPANWNRLPTQEVTTVYQMCIALLFCTLCLTLLYTVLILIRNRIIQKRINIHLSGIQYKLQTWYDTF